MDLVIPEALAASHRRYSGEAGRRWIAGLPTLVRRLLDQWSLTTDGAVRHGAVALVLPVRTAAGTPAVLKVQPVDDETAGEPDALRAWNGDGAVRLLDHDQPTGAMLIERCDDTRSLAQVDDDQQALTVLAGLLGRLTSHPAPPGLRRLSEIARDLLDRVPAAAAKTGDAELRTMITNCAAATAEVIDEPGDRLLHWDLHFENVLASRPGGGREPWLAIDPKPLAGDPGFDAFAALHNRWQDVLATGDVERAVRRRFDLITDVAGLDRDRTRAWTLARVLQNQPWEIEADTESSFTEPDRVIARILLDR